LVFQEHHKKGKYAITSMQGGGHGAGAVVGNFIVLISKEESTFVDGPQPRYDVKQVLPLVYGDVESLPFACRGCEREEHH